MKRPEILAPVGSPEALDAALAAGANAIYCALQQFGARAYAANFTLEQLKEVIDRCHRLDVKVYIAMNTVIYENEMEAAYQQAKACHELGVDALIIQDLGLAYLVHHRLPHLEIHASTQMSIQTPEQIRQLKKLGFTRVVLARECSLEQIRLCCQEGLEIEVFVHGALCISYSGHCYFSSFRYDRSGNRGMCAQPCRMAYTLLEDGQPVKTEGPFLLSPKDISLLDHLDELEVDSLKIEGRMKSAAYVYATVQNCQRALNHEKINHDDLAVTFSRGFSLGHAYRAFGHDLMNTKASNHQGIEVGQVIGQSKGFIQIQLTKEVRQEDGLRIGDRGFRANFLYAPNGKLISLGLPGQIVMVKGHAKKGTKVLKTISVALEKEVSQLSDRKVTEAITIRCRAVNQELEIDWQGQTFYSGVYAQMAQKRASDHDLMVKQFSKTSQDWLNFAIQTDLADHLFFTLPDLNRIRRELIEWIGRQKCQIKPVIEKDYPEPPVAQSDLVASYEWNATNHWAVYALLEMGYGSVVLSIECDLEQIKAILAHGVPAKVPIDFLPRLMHMNHCPVNTALRDGSRKNCQLCHQHRYELLGKDGSKVLLEGDRACRMQVFDLERVKRQDWPKQLENLSFDGFWSN